MSRTASKVRKNLSVKTFDKTGDTAEDKLLPQSPLLYHTCYIKSNFTLL